MSNKSIFVKTKLLSPQGTGSNAERFFDQGARKVSNQIMTAQIVTNANSVRIPKR